MGKEVSFKHLTCPVRWACSLPPGHGVGLSEGQTRRDPRSGFYALLTIFEALTGVCRIGELLGVVQIQGYEDVRRGRKGNLEGEPWRGEDLTAHAGHTQRPRVWIQSPPCHFLAVGASPSASMSLGPPPGKRIPVEWLPLCLLLLAADAGAVLLIDCHVTSGSSR